MLVPTLLRFFRALLPLALFALPARALDKTANPDLNNRLHHSPTRLDQLGLLQDGDLLYDFSKNPEYSWSPGSVCNANAATWPYLATDKVTVAQLNLGPCSMLAPHLHRTSNYVVAVNGTTHTFMVQENGARMVEQILRGGQMTVFPPASMHSMYNLECTPTQLYSFLPSNDPGTLNVANAFMMMPEEAARHVMPFITLGYGDWQDAGQNVLPVGHGVQQGLDSCLQRCNLGSGGAPVPAEQAVNVKRLPRGRAALAGRDAVESD